MKKRPRRASKYNYLSFGVIIIKATIIATQIMTGVTPLFTLYKYKIDAVPTIAIDKVLIP